MKQALLNLLNNALHPFGLRALTQDQIAGLSYHNYLHDLFQSRHIAQQERMVQMHLDALSSRPATLPPRRKRRGRPPIVERLTMAQVKMVRNKRLSTNRLAKKLGVTWPTANKLRDELA